MPRPWDHGMVAWTFEPAAAGSTFLAAAGVLYLSRIYIRGNAAANVANIGVVVQQAGTGATALANCFMGIYDVNGNLVANSGTADQSASWATAGFKKIPMTAAVQLQPGAAYWLGLVVGQQATTPVQLTKSTAITNQINANLVNTTVREGSQLTGLTSMPASFAPGSTGLASTFWGAVL